MVRHAGSASHSAGKPLAKTQNAPPCATARRGRFAQGELGGRCSDRRGCRDHGDAVDRVLSDPEQPAEGGNLARQRLHADVVQACKNGADSQYGFRLDCGLEFESEVGEPACESSNRERGERANNGDDEVGNGEPFG